MMLLTAIIEDETVLVTAINNSNSSPIHAPVPSKDLST